MQFRLTCRKSWLSWPLEICSEWQNCGFEAGRSNLMGLFSDVLEFGRGSLVNTGRQWEIKKKKKKNPYSALLAVLIKERPTVEHFLVW